MSLLNSPEAMPSALFTSSTTSPPPTTTTDSTLKNMTSQSPVRPNAAKRLSLPPSSIPSSPTSIHSSSSAIFERDIEPLPMPLLSPLSPSAASSNPHRIPRAKGSEALDASVPTVLDSAASILVGAGTTSPDLPLEDITIITPVTNTHSVSQSLLNALDVKQQKRQSTSGWTSPIGSWASRSRSVSPDGGLLLNIPTSAPLSAASSPVSVNRGMFLEPGTSHSPPSSPPTSFPASFSSSPQRHAPLSSPPITQSTHTVSKRLSFISHADLLSATPSNAVSLNWLTTHAGETTDATGAVSPTKSNRSSMLVENFFQPPPSLVHSAAAVSPTKSNRSSILLDTADREALGGEWEREGLGKGLEARLGI